MDSTHFRLNHYLGGIVHFFMAHLFPKFEMRRVYYRVFKEYPNLDHPIDLIEKIYWLQLHSDTSMWTKCADKYLVRDYVSECGLGSYLPQLYGKWDRPEEINFGVLPNELVFKSNNSCGTVRIIHDLRTENKEILVALFREWLSTKYGLAGAQLHYLGIKPCIIAEELLQQDLPYKLLSPKSLIDFKIWCINGIPECVWTASNRTPSHLNMCLFNTDWEPMPEFLVSSPHYEYNPDLIIPKPVCLDEMFFVAKRLASSFPIVRIDFYCVNEKPIIGEMTFTSGYGYFSKEFYEYLGRKVDLTRFNCK